VISKPTEAVDPRQFGARADGRHDDTDAVQAAIDAAGPTEVRLRGGVFLCRTLHLRSHLTLSIGADATLLGHHDPEQYRGLAGLNDPTDAKMGERWHRGLLVGDELEHVTLQGQGTIDGQDVFDPLGEEKMRGPHTVMLRHCRDVRIEGLTFVRSGNYAIFAKTTDRLDVHQVTVQGGWDGVHLRGMASRPCEAARITECTFETGDDAIAGWYWQDAFIADCRINTSCNGLRVIGPVDGLQLLRCAFHGPGHYPHRTYDKRGALCAVLLQPGAWSPVPGRLDRIDILDNKVDRFETAFACHVHPGGSAVRIRIENFTAGALTGPASSLEAWGQDPIQYVVLRDIELRRDPDSPPVIDRGQVRRPRVSCRPLPTSGVWVYRVQQLDMDSVRFA